MDRVNYPHYYLQRLPKKDEKNEKELPRYVKRAISGEQHKPACHFKRRLAADNMTWFNGKFSRYTPTEYRDEIGRVGMWFTRLNVHNEYHRDIARVRGRIKFEYDLD